MLKNNIIATFLYVFISICFFESCVECPIFAGMTMMGMFFVFYIFIFSFLSSLAIAEKK